jgi:hypothetical protein
MSVYSGQTADQLVRKAIEKDTLAEALAFVAVVECERAMEQRKKFEETGRSMAAQGGWDTCFAFLFNKVLNDWQARELARGPDVREHRMRS